MERVDVQLSHFKYNNLFFVLLCIYLNSEIKSYNGTYMFDTCVVI